MSNFYMPMIPHYCQSDAPDSKWNQWIPLTSLDQMSRTDYDVLIVGSGAGGGAALWRLCEKLRHYGKRIGIIEAGGLMLQTNAYNIPTMNQYRLWNYFLNTSYPIGRILPQYPSARQLFALGGRTLFWTGVTPRMISTDFMDWPIPMEEIEKYYNIAEQAMYVNNNYSKGSSLTDIMLDRLWNGGFPEAGYTPMAVDLSQTKHGEINSNVIFSSIIFLARALNICPYDLSTNVRVTRVMVDKGKAIGVQAVTPDKKSYFLKAKNVILAAGTLETPRILLNSGIQGSAIGHYLTDHTGVYTRGILNTKHLPEVVGALGLYIPATATKPYMVQIQGPLEPEWNYVMYKYKDKPAEKEQWGYEMYAFGKVESRYDNRVSLSPLLRDEYGIPMIQVHYSNSAKDFEVIRQMTLALSQISEAMEAPLLVKNNRPDICTWLPGRSIHESGTCRMGKDPDTSATNQYAQVHGIPGLYVTDNSMLPPIGAANPTLTTVAMSIRTADYISEQLK